MVSYQSLPVVQAVLYTNPDRVPPVINSTRVLAQAGFRVRMIARDYKKQWNIAYPPGTEVHRVKKRARASWREYLDFIIETFRLADKSAVAIVGHDMHGFLVAALVAAVYRRPLVYHCHDYVENGRRVSFGARLVRTLEHRFARSAAMVIVPDASRAQVMAREMHLVRPPVVVANAPLASSRTTANLLAAALAEQGHHFERIVLRQGVLGPGHAIEATIRSILHWACRRWGFVLMGFGEQEYLDRLHELAASLGVADQFTILPPVSYDQIARYTAGADVGHALYDPVNVNHVHMGTASNKILEYMAAGLPLLLSDRPSFHPLVQKYHCGVLVDESSPESIAAAINRVLGDPERSRAMGEAGAAAFSRELSYERQYAPALGVFSTFAHAGHQVD